MHEPLTMIRLFLTLLLLGTLACQQQKPQNQQANSEPINLEEFYEFYREFHRDSLFQVEHIIWPLEGLPDNVDSITLHSGAFRWQRENWTFQRTIDFEMSDFRRQITPVTDFLVTEQIVHTSGKYGMIRRFSKIAGDWYLIYYAGLNQLATASGE